MKRNLVGILVSLSLVVVLFTACADKKGPAEIAVKAAEQAVAATKAEAVKFVPAQTAALETALTSLQEKMAKEEYEAVTADAQALVGRAKQVLAAAKAKKSDLTKKWTDLTQGIPEMVGAIQAKVDALSQMKKLPKGMTADILAESKSALEALKADWAKAEETFKAGNITDAITLSTSVKEKAAKAMEVLGIAAAPTEPAAPVAPVAPEAPKKQKS